MLTSLLTTLEIGLLLVGLVLVFNLKTQSLARSWLYAYAFGISYLSVVAQFVFLAGIIQFPWVADMLVLLPTSLIWLYLYRTRGLHGMKLAFMGSWEVLVLHKWIGMPIILAIAYLGSQAWFLPPSSHDGLAYNLARVMIFIQEGSLHPDAFNYINQAIHPPGHDILGYWFLRFYSDFGLGLFSVLAYLAIFAGSFHLVRELTLNNAIAVTVALLLVSMPEIVIQATSVKNDIPLGALALVALCGATQWVQEGKWMDLGMLLLALAAGVSFKTYFVLCALPIALVSLWLRWIQRGEAPFILLRQPILLSAGLVFLLATGVSAFFGLHLFRNFQDFGSPVGTETAIAVHSQNDGLAGGIINTLRYVFQMVVPPGPLGGDVLGRSFVMLTSGLSEQGLAAPYSSATLVPSMASLIPQEEISWFGVPGTIFILASMVYALFRGSGIVRGSALIQVIFLFLLSYTIGWSPWSNRFFTVFFCCGVLPAGAFLERLNHLRLLRTLLVGYSGLVFMYAAFGNIQKPLANVYKLAFLGKEKYRLPINADFRLMSSGIGYPGPWVGTWLHFVTNRDDYAKMHYFADVMDLYRNQSIEPGARILIVAPPDSQILSFLLAHPRARTRVSSPEAVDTEQGSAEIEASDFILLMGREWPETWPAGSLLFTVPKNLSGRTPLQFRAIRSLKKKTFRRFARV